MKQRGGERKAELVEPGRAKTEGAQQKKLETKISCSKAMHKESQGEAETIASLRAKV